MDDVVEIPLTYGYVAIIDAADAPLVQQHKWRVMFVAHRRYAASSRGLLMHRLLVEAGDLDVDHIDHDGLNNRRSNLRVRTRSKNLLNWGTKSKNKLGCYGVYQRRGYDLFYGYVGVRRGYRRKTSGYRTIEQAARARDALLVQLRPDTWHHGQLNFPDEMTPERVRELTKGRT